MAGRRSEPWFWAARGEWCVKIKGKRHRLGVDKAEAYRLFHLLMAGEQVEGPVQGRNWLYASEVADRFQTALKHERAVTTLNWYCQYLDPFKERFMNARADTLPADGVREWVNGRWMSQASRRAALRSVKAAFRRAVHDGLLQSCPVLWIKLPGETTRDLVISKEQYELILSKISDETFADLIRFIWMSGARAQEAVLIEDCHVDKKNSRIVLPINKAKGKKRPRVIYLPAAAMAIVEKNKGNRRVFQTKSGKAFTKDIVRQRFRTLEGKLKTRYCLTHFRHGFAHRSLAAGNDALTVATLMGHSSTQTLAKVYAHLNQADGHLREALRKTE